jgi:hypothetical protein
MMFLMYVEDMLPYIIPFCNLEAFWKLNAHFGKPSIFQNTFFFSPYELNKLHERKKKKIMEVDFYVG